MRAYMYTIAGGQACHLGCGRNLRMHGHVLRLNA